MKKLKNWFLFLALFVLAFFPCKAVFAESQADIETVRAVVIEVVDFDNVNPRLKNIISKTQAVKVKILSGSFQNEIVNIANEISGNEFFDLELKKGDRVILQVEESGGEYKPYILDKDRTFSYAVLASLFLVLLLFLSGRKGLLTLISSILFFFLIFVGFSELVFRRFDPLFAAALVSAAGVVVYSFINFEIRKRTVFIVASGILSVLLSAIIAFFAVKSAALTGISGEETMIMAEAMPSLSFKSILMGGIVFSSFGFVLYALNYVFAPAFNLLPLEKGSVIKNIRKMLKRPVVITSNIMFTMFLGYSVILILLSKSIDLMKYINLNIVATVVIFSLAVAISSFVSLLAALLSLMICNNSMRNRQS